jgi:tRNA(fMet)-specific endonuclease VapC
MVVEAPKASQSRVSAKGHLIGTNDLWIAATAIVHGMPLVTNNREEFERVPGLVVLTYG